MNPMDSIANATTIVIFGASGDLTRRKLIPALYNNFKKKRLPAGLANPDFRRLKALYRQLEMEGRSVLSAIRQGDACQKQRHHR